MRHLCRIALIAALGFLPGAALAQSGQALAELASQFANASVPIAISTATTTELIAKPTCTSPGGATCQIYVTAYEVMAAGTGNIKFVYGTGTACGTGQTDLTGNYNLVAQTRIEHGAGFGPVWVLPAGNALCAVTSAAVGMAGSVSYRVK